MKFHLPKSIDEALALSGMFRAGGTDLQELRMLTGGPFADADLIALRDVDGLTGVSFDAGILRIGGMTRVQAIADDPAIATGWPGLSAACAALATPQIRNVATIAGSLMQAPRCWYYRHPDYTCLRKGGDTCEARAGDHLLHVCFDTAPCAAPHPSTTALALLAYDAQVGVCDRKTTLAQLRTIPIVESLGETEVLVVHVEVGVALPGEQAAYVRASNRAYAEWALVEAVVRLRRDPAGRIDFARVCIGAVAPTPLRLAGVEAALLGRAPVPGTLVAAAELAAEGATPLPNTTYKLALVRATVLEALERALAAAPTPAGLP